MARYFTITIPIRGGNSNTSKGMWHRNNKMSIGKWHMKTLLFLTTLVLIVVVYVRVQQVQENGVRQIRDKLEVHAYGAKPYKSLALTRKEVHRNRISSKKGKKDRKKNVAPSLSVAQQAGKKSKSRSEERKAERAQTRSAKSDQKNRRRSDSRKKDSGKYRSGERLHIPNNRTSGSAKISNKTQKTNNVAQAKKITYPQSSSTPIRLGGPPPFAGNLRVQSIGKLKDQPKTENRSKVIQQSDKHKDVHDKEKENNQGKSSREIKAKEEKVLSSAIKFKPEDNLKPKLDEQKDTRKKDEERTDPNRNIVMRSENDKFKNPSIKSNSKSNTSSPSTANQTKLSSPLSKALGLINTEKSDLRKELENSHGKSSIEEVIGLLNDTELAALLETEIALQAKFKSNASANKNEVDDDTMSTIWTGLHTVLKTKPEVDSETKELNTDTNVPLATAYPVPPPPLAIPRYREPVVSYVAAPLPAPREVLVRDSNAAEGTGYYKDEVYVNKADLERLGRPPVDPNPYNRVVATRITPPERYYGEARYVEDRISSKRYSAYPTQNVNLGPMPRDGLYEENYPRQDRALPVRNNAHDSQQSKQAAVKTGGDLLTDEAGSFDGTDAFQDDEDPTGVRESVARGALPANDIDTSQNTVRSKMAQYATVSAQNDPTPAEIKPVARLDRARSVHAIPQ